jgi:hypothetical protein
MAVGLRRWAGRILLVSMAAVVLGACGKKPPPPLSAIVDAPAIRPGSSWTYRVEDSSWSAPNTLTLTFAKEDIYKGGAVLTFNAGGETLLYDRNLNFVSVSRDGRTLREATPSVRAFEFPFYVGKEWRSVFAFEDYVKGLRWIPVEVYWRVKEYDLIKVPAGEFRAFLLESKPSTNWGVGREQIWYAPDVRQPIRIRRNRTSAHYLGAGKEHWELVQYVLR